MPGEVVLALGSNLGDRAKTIRSAISEIGTLPGFSNLRSSRLYESAALTSDGISDTEPAYLNAVLTGDYAETPESLLVELQKIELKHGRERSARWAARTLDIDIIKFGDLIMSDETLTLPHPEAGNRPFVLVPWLEIQPDATLPASPPLRPLSQGLLSQVRIYADA